MIDIEDSPADQSTRNKQRSRWGCTIAALIVLLPLIYIFGDFYRLEKISPAITRSPSGCEIQAYQIGDWKSEMLNSGQPAENLDYPLKVMISVQRCPAVPNGKPYTVQLMLQPSGRSVATGLDCGSATQPSDSLCRIEVPPIPTRKAPHQFILQIVRKKGEPPEAVPVGIILTRQWRSIAWDGLMSV